MKYVSPEYQKQLNNLAETLCPRRTEDQLELDFEPGMYAELADVVIERPEIAQIGRTATFGWDSEGRYLEAE